MPGIKRDADTAFSEASVSLSTLLSHFAEGDSAASQSAAAALTRVVYASRKEPLAAWVQLKSHLERHNGFPELLSVLEIASRTKDADLMTSALSLCAAILALPPPTIVDVQDVIIKELLARDSGHLASLGRALSAQKRALNTAALRVVKALVQSPTRARRVWEGISIDAKVMSRLLGIRRVKDSVSLTRPDVRTLTLLCLLPLLSPTSSSRLKAEILRMKGFGKALFAEISRDPLELLDKLLEVLYYGVLADERLDSEVRLQLVTASWEPLLSLLAPTEDDERAAVASSALRFLQASISLLAEWNHKGINKALGALLSHLKPTDDERQADLLELALRLRPALLSEFWKRFVPLLEPRLSLKWLSSITLAIRIASLPLDEQSLTSDNLSHLFDLSLPSSLSKQKSSKALQSGEKGLVSYMTATFLLACLNKARAICLHLEKQGRHEMLDSFKAELQDRVPDTSVIIALAQKAGSSAGSDAGSVVSTTNEEIEANGPILSTCLQLLELYFELLEPNLRFDFGKFRRLLVVTDDPFACTAQASLLRILCSPLATFDVQNALAALIRLYLDTKVSTIKDLVRSTLTQLLERSPLFEHDAGEVAIWLDALSQHAPISLLVFFESCAKDCMLEPWRHAEVISLLFPRPISPLFSVMLQRLPSEADASEPLLFFRHLAFSFARRAGDGLETAQIIATETAKRLSDDVRDSIVTECQLIVDCVSALKGKPPTGARKHGKSANPSPISKNVLANAKAKIGDNIDDEILLCHVVAARRFDHPALVSTLTASTSKQRLIDLLLSALSASDNMDAAAFDLVRLLIGQDGILLEQTLQNASLLNLLGIPSRARHVLELVLQARQQTLAASAIGPIIDHLVALFRSGDLAAGSLANMLPSLLPLFSEEQLLSIADALLAQVEHAAEIEAHVEAVQCFLDPLLAHSTMSSHMADLCFKHFRTLYELHAERHMEAAGELLARGVESSLPDGLAYAPLDKRPQYRSLVASQCRVFASVDEDQMTAWTRAILLLPAMTESDARILSAAIYRHPAYRILYEAHLSMPTAVAEPDIALRPLHAFLEATAASGIALSEDETAVVEDRLISIGANIATAGDEALRLFCRCYSLLLPMREILAFGTLQTLAQRVPSAVAIEGIGQLAAQDERVMPILLESLRSCILWLVRRYAEDEQDSQHVVEVAHSIVTALDQLGYEIALDESVVAPVLQAIIQNRLFSASALQLAAMLAERLSLKDATCLRLLRQLAAHSHLRKAASDEGSSTALLALIEALARVSPTSAAQSSIAEHLLPVYGATASSEDQKLLQLFRLSEENGGRSLRASLGSWAPPILKRTHDVRGLDILTVLDADMSHKACLRVLRDDTEWNASSYDPAFLLTLLAAYLESGPRSHGDWLALAEANVFGLAVCCLARSNAQMHSEGDRCLAKLANRLEESDFVEKEELVLVFDHIRAAINTESPLPALAALFYARCLRSIATPDDDFYTILMPFLLQRPIFDLHDVPLLYQLLFSSARDAREHRVWLLELLRDGLCSPRDWLMFKRRQTADLLFSLLSSGGADAAERMLILSILERAAQMSIAANDLIGRRGLLTWPILSPPSSEEESLIWLRILDKASKSADRERIDRDGTGIWLLDLLLATEALSKAQRTDQHLIVGMRVLRRIALYAQPGQKQVVGLLSKALREVFAKALPYGAVADAHDAAIRCVRLGGDKALFEPAVGLALAHGASEVRQWVLSALHSSQDATTMMQDV